LKVRLGANIHQLAPARAGWNMKACEMNAAFGLAQLQKLERFKADVKIPADEQCGC
jgi:dTDP-4-amino-4,6-dideoxygalactose transaminase